MESQEKLARLIADYEARSALLKQLDFVAPRTLMFETLHKGMMENVKLQQHADYLDRTLKTTAAVLISAPVLLACGAAVGVLKAAVDGIGVTGAMAMKLKLGIAVTVGGARFGVLLGLTSVATGGDAVTTSYPSILLATFKALKEDPKLRRAYQDYSTRVVALELQDMTPVGRTLCNLTMPEQVHEFHKRFTERVTWEVDQLPGLKNDDNARTFARNLLCYRFWYDARRQVERVQQRLRVVLPRLKGQINALARK